MPQVCTFYGITIYIYYDDHPDPHFHAFYGGREVTVAITDLRAMDGAITPRAMGLVVEWAAKNSAALMEDWVLSSTFHSGRSHPSSKMRREMLRIRKVAPIADQSVRLTLTNGDVVERDPSALLWGPLFEPLRSDANRFRQVAVSGGTLVWPGDLDFDPDTLIWGGPRPPDPNASPPKFLALERRITAAGHS